MLRLPNLALSPNVLKLSLALKHIQAEFSNEQIIFGDCEKERRPNC